MRSVTTRLLLIFLVVSALAVGLAGSAAATTGGPPRLFVYPGFVELTDGETVEIFAFYCPVTATGEPDFGLDGVPGTPDDDCVPALVDWFTPSELGMVFPASGTSTIFTPAVLPPGVDEETTFVGAADSSGQTALVDVLIRRAFEPEPIQVLVLEPPDLELPARDTQSITALSGSPNPDGGPNFGDDGVPGTPDDDFEPASVTFSTTGGIGSLDPISGSTTTLTAADTFVPLMGQVIATHADGRMASADVFVEPIQVLVLEPPDLELPARDTQSIAALSGPPNPDGTPDKGEDGVAGTADDDFQPADVSFSTSGGIGTLDPASGSTTTLTAAATLESLIGQVIATHADGRTATSNVRVTAAALNIRTSPDTINKKAKGKYITAYIESGAGAVDVSQLDLSSIRLQVVFPFGSSELPIAPGAPTAIGDDDGNGVADLAVKFDRATVQSWFPGPAEPIFRITAELLDVRRHVFGDAMARVIDQGSQHTSEDDHGSVQP